MQSSSNTPSDAPNDPAEPDPLQALLHRWFVQYNPVYLASAALVLGGLTLVSREASESVSGLGRFGVAAVAELYALTLIAGAALLVRIERRRPAAMLALLAVLYQGDLTLHVETSAYLGEAGFVAAMVWVALFVAKLHALAAAMQLRASLSAMLVPAIGALGLAWIPQVLRDLSIDDRTTLITCFVFGIGAAGLWTRRTIESAIGFDVRGRRAIRFTWAVWSTLGVAHVLYWATEHRMHVVALLPVAMLLATRYSSERQTWIVCGATSCTIGIVSPSSLSVTALMLAVVLVLHALRRPSRRATHEPSSVQPYREVERAAPEVILETIFERAPDASMRRLLLGAAWSVHLSLWTAGWAGDVWPEHGVVLDLALALGCLVTAWRLRRPLLVAPAALTYVHLLAHEGWISAPRTAAQWGLLAIALGFTLLVGPLLASWRLHRHTRAPGRAWTSARSGDSLRDS